MLIKVKNNFIATSRILMIHFANSQKNGKNYLIVEVDAENEKQKNIFIEVIDENEFNFLMTEISSQLK